MGISIVLFTLGCVQVVLETETKTSILKIDREMMSMLDHSTIVAALEAQPLFDQKTWQLSPQAWPLTSVEVDELEEIGRACVEFYRAADRLYERSWQGKNILRNSDQRTPWVAEYLDRGKPEALIALNRARSGASELPRVIRPDLIRTETGWMLSELDSVPGGIGLTAFLNRLYAPVHSILGEGDAMIHGFYSAVTAGWAGECAPVIAIAVSEEADTYRPEMQWLSSILLDEGKTVYCVDPNAMFVSGDRLCFELNGHDEHIDILYRFWELFDHPQIRTMPDILAFFAANKVKIHPSPRTIHEEKLWMALFHHPRLATYWAEQLGKQSLKRLQQLIPRTWIVDSAELPPSAYLDGPSVGGKPIFDWMQLAQASQKERQLILKISGFHETAWGARSVVLGSDVSREEWIAALRTAVDACATGPLYILQEYHKPKKMKHPLFVAEDQIVLNDGRLRLCPYYFVTAGKPVFSGALATFCPADKKIIHGMKDAALLPCRVG
jgi:hypothetical protein